MAETFPKSLAIVPSEDLRAYQGVLCRAWKCALPSGRTVLLLAPNIVADEAGHREFREVYGRSIFLVPDSASRRGRDANPFL